MGSIETIKQSIESALKHESALTEEQLAVGGFTSIKIRHLLNNLGVSATGYFEVGSHIGSTYISTVWANHSNLQGRYVACDNFAEFNNDGKTEALFRKNCVENLQHYTLINKSCWGVTASDIGFSPDLYLYDGGHDYESQKKAVTHFSPLMAKEFIMCVDDSSWQSVRRGTFDGIKEANLEVVYEQSLWDGVESNNEMWHNGFMILLLKRN